MTAPALPDWPSFDAIDQRPSGIADISPGFFYEGLFVSFGRDREVTRVDMPVSLRLRLGQILHEFPGASLFFRFVVHQPQACTADNHAPVTAVSRFREERRTDFEFAFAR